MTKKPVKHNPVIGGVSLSAFLYAISKVESGNYGAVNPDSGALGKYQVLPSNVAGWSQEALGYSITPQQFLATPKLQERIVRFKLGHYFRSYGPAGAASAWYSGSPTNANSTTPNGAYPSVAEYVQNVYNIARGAMHLKPQQLAANPGAGSSGGSVVNVSNPFPGGSWDPLNWVAGGIDSATGAIVTSLEKLTVEGLLILAGVGIIVVGAYESFKREDDGSSSGGGGGLVPMPAPGKAGAAAGGAGDVAELAALA
jgi:hypothetical protein